MSSASSALTSSNMLFARSSCSTFWLSQATSRSSAGMPGGVASRTAVVMSEMVEYRSSRSAARASACQRSFRGSLVMRSSRESAWKRLNTV